LTYSIVNTGISSTTLNNTITITYKFNIVATGDIRADAGAIHYTFTNAVITVPLVIMFTLTVDPLIIQPITVSNASISKDGTATISAPNLDALAQAINFVTGIDLLTYIDNLATTLVSNNIKSIDITSIIQSQIAM